MSYVTFYLIRHSDATQIQKKLNSYTRKSARHAISYARAVWATLVAQEDTASKEIDEMEEYLGLLRAKRDIIINPHPGLRGRRAGGLSQGSSG